MNFVLGTTINLFLACMMTIQATEIGENAVFFRSVLMVKQDNKSSLSELANVWMDIQKGIYPNVSSGDIRIKVGEPITILIYLNDQHKRNITVEECWAYNEENYDNATINLQLANTSTDFRKLILMNQLPRKLYSHPQNITTLLYTNLTSFKFPEKEYVYIGCSVKLCHGPCSENLKRRWFPPKLNSTIMEESQPLTASRNNTKFLFSKLKPPPSYTTENTLHSNCTSEPKHLLCFLKPPSQCTHGSKDPYCINTIPPTSCHADSQDPKCHNKPPTHCYPGSPDPQCNVNYPPTCYPGSKDNHCESTPPTDCYPGSQNPQCNTKPPTTCYPGSQDPQCHSNSSMPSDCFPGSQELHCNFSSQPPNCYPGSQNPQCNSNLPRTCHPGSEDPECNSDPPTCYPGSQNPHCNSNLPPNCYPGSEDPRCNSNSPPNCYPGSQDPRCNLNSLPNCFPGSEDPHCNFLVPQCYPGSQNPQCNSFSPPPICYPGSQNPLCKVIPRCSPNSRNPKCTNIIKLASHCNSSSFDPRCDVSPIKNYNDSSSIPPKQLPILCFFNILNPKCQHIKKRSTTAGATEKSTSIPSDITNTKLASSPDCSSHSDSIDPRCSADIDIDIKSTTQPSMPIKCIPGVFHRRCITETSAHKKLAYNPFLPPNCYPSSKDPRCKTPAPDESDDSINKFSHNSFKPPNCYPGSKDPRCSKYT